MLRVVQPGIEREHHAFRRRRTLPLADPAEPAGDVGPRERIVHHFNGDRTFLGSAFRRSVSSRQCEASRPVELPGGGGSGHSGEFLHPVPGDPPVSVFRTGGRGGQQQGVPFADPERPAVLCQGIGLLPADGDGSPESVVFE
ncbi:hypothetical protein SDC9_171210 [bioreactor metagenome]|uniref:Uncharacterized protein n=1 Tax=bioreactor metagenome TaxID=1076179 RepID=A0A645GA77_9ZZZZ